MGELKGKSPWLLAYGLIGPFAARLKAVLEEEAQFYRLIREVLVANLYNHPANICIEVGRQNTPHQVRPSFADLEQALPAVVQVTTLGQSEGPSSGENEPRPISSGSGAIIDARLAFLVSGGTGSGKTTLLSTLLEIVEPSQRILLVEDSAELRPRHPHVVRLEARPANLEGAGQVTLRDLVRQALRMRPDRVIVGVETARGRKVMAGSCNARPFLAFCPIAGAEPTPHPNMH